MEANLRQRKKNKIKKDPVSQNNETFSQHFDLDGNRLPYYQSVFRVSRYKDFYFFFLITLAETGFHRLLLINTFPTF